MKSIFLVLALITLGTFSAHAEGPIPGIGDEDIYLDDKSGAGNGNECFRPTDKAGAGNGSEDDTFKPDCLDGETVIANVYNYVIQDGTAVRLTISRLANDSGVVDYSKGNNGQNMSCEIVIGGSEAGNGREVFSLSYGECSVLSGNINSRQFVEQKLTKAIGTRLVNPNSGLPNNGTVFTAPGFAY